MRLQDWMQAEEIDDDALAERLQVSRATVSRVRRGANKPGWELIGKLTVATRGQVTADDFMDVVPVRSNGN